MNPKLIEKILRRRGLSGGALVQTGKLWEARINRAVAVVGILALLSAIGLVGHEAYRDRQKAEPALRLVSEPLPRQRPIDLDLNGDGRVSVAEWQQVRESFDRDLDGKLKGVELADVEDSLALTQKRVGTARLVAEIDQTTDLANQYELLQRLDVNRDGRLTPEELRDDKKVSVIVEVAELKQLADIGSETLDFKIEAPPISERSRASRDELRKLGTATFDFLENTFDENRDGLFSLAEMEQALAYWQQAMVLYDSNGDGRLDAREGRRALQEIDTDKDRRLSRQEAQAVMSRARPARP